MVFFFLLIQSTLCGNKKKRAAGNSWGKALAEGSAFSHTAKEMAAKEISETLENFQNLRRHKTKVKFSPEQLLSHATEF